MPRFLRINDRHVPISIVDPNCPTIVERSIWTHLGAHSLKRHLERIEPVRLLVAQAERLWVIAVKSTYPDFSIEIFEITQIEFIRMAEMLQHTRIAFDNKTNWKEEGF